MKNFLIYIGLFIFLSSCSNPKKEAEEEHHEEPEGNTVSITDVQIKTADIQFGEIELKNLKTSIKANGNLTVPNQNKALVTSITSGIVKS
ncbi:MAG: efflux RND transporter periplasmic adaptor subunit, partial [Sphingobacteriales bacterium]